MHNRLEQGVGGQHRGVVEGLRPPARWRAASRFGSVRPSRGLRPKERSGMRGRGSQGLGRMGFPRLTQGHTWQPHRTGLRLQSVTEGSSPVCESVDTAELAIASTKPKIASMMKKKRP